MARKQKEIIMPHFNDCGGDLTKKWYVEYSIRNPKTLKMERVRIYECINQFSTYRERFDFAQGVIVHYSKQIQLGNISYQEFVEEDMLLYDGQRSNKIKHNFLLTELFEQPQKDIFTCPYCN